MSSSVLALDYGRRRVGVAIGDLQLKIAHPLSTVRYNSWEDLKKQLEQLIDEWRPDRLVVGIPARQDDSEHELAKEIRNFSKNLGDLFGMPVVLLDESYTSVESENFLSTMGVKGRDQKAYVDSIAAATILGDFFKKNEC